MLKLYYLPGACSTVPHVALVWSGLPFETEAVKRDALKTPEYLALNPQGQVPLLTDDGWALSQNVAIIDYLDELAPDALIFGSRDTREKAKARQWLAFANSDLHKAFGPIFGAAYMVDGDAAQESLKTRARGKILSLFESVEKHLQRQKQQGADFLAGSRISIADVYVYVAMRWAKMCAIDLGGYSRLQDFYRLVEADGGVQTVLKAQGLA